MKYLATGVLLIGLCFIVAGCFGGGFTPSQTYTVSGKVTYQDGQPIPDVTLSFDKFGTATTDNEGRYSKSGLHGKVAIYPAKINFSFDPPSRTVSGPTSDANFIGTSFFSDMSINYRLLERIKEQREPIATPVYSDRLSIRVEKPGFILEPGYYRIQVQGRIQGDTNWHTFYYDTSAQTFNYLFEGFPAPAEAYEIRVLQDDSLVYQTTNNTLFNGYFMQFGTVKVNGQQWHRGITVDPTDDTYITIMKEPYKDCRYYKVEAHFKDGRTAQIDRFGLLRLAEEMIFDIYPGTFSSGDNFDLRIELWESASYGSKHGPIYISSVIWIPDIIAQ